MIHFVVHDENDSIGVVVVDQVKAGERMTGWILDQDKTIQCIAAADAMRGHRIAIRPLAANDTVFNHGVNIGRARTRIPAGALLSERSARFKR